VRVTLPRNSTLTLPPPSAAGPALAPVGRGILWGLLYASLSEEASILNFPALNLRDAHERPEAMEEAIAMMVGLEPERVSQGLAILAAQPRGERRMLRLVADYEALNVSDKVVRIIHSYTDYVRRVVWRELG